MHIVDGSHNLLTSPGAYYPNTNPLNWHVGIGNAQTTQSAGVVPFCSKLATEPFSSVLRYT